MNTYGRLRCFAALGALALPWGTPAMANEPTVSITTEYLMTVYLPKEAALSVDPSLSISRDPAGGWVRGKVSGRVLDPSADWVRIIPSDAFATPIRRSRNYRNRRPRDNIYELQRQNAL